MGRPSPAGSQGGQDSNLQPAVLETAALPIEPPPYATRLAGSQARNRLPDAPPTRLNRIEGAIDLG
jgi:hypothetical protein